MRALKKAWVWVTPEKERRLRAGEWGRVAGKIRWMAGDGMRAKLEVPASVAARMEAAR